MPLIYIVKFFKMDVPAPWSLSGKGYILMYRFPLDFIRDSCFLPDDWKENKWSGLGYVMFADYQESPVGPYREVLVIPGKSEFGGNKLSTISKIFVDSFESMDNARTNWGIPKELTEIDWSVDGKQDLIRVGIGEPWMEILLEHGSLPIPLDTRLIPLNLYQESGEHAYITKPSGRGTGRFAIIKGISVDPNYFPAIDQLEPIVAFCVDPFSLTFPAAKVHTLAGV